MRAAICYLTWNRFQYTKKSLASIVQYTNRDDYELILWDNGSTEEGMIDWLREFCKEHKFNYLFFNKNEGLTKAMNNQMKIMDYLGKFDVFCHIANDYFMPEGWLDGVFQVIPHKKVGIVGLNPEHKTFKTESINGLNLSIIEPDGNVSGAHFCIPKKTYDKFGCFQTVVSGYGQQDANYCLKVKLFPDEQWCYYLPLVQYPSVLGSSLNIYPQYQSKMSTRLRLSGSDPVGGSSYRNLLTCLKNDYKAGKLSKDQLLAKYRDILYVKFDIAEVKESSFNSNELTDILANLGD